MRVLVIEDEPTLCDVYEDFLSERGHETLIAQTAEDAIATLQTQRLDAVLLDIHLPGMSGLDLLRMRITHEMGVPVIVVSGVVGDQQARECLALGAREFMGKPVSLERLGDAIDSLIADEPPPAGERRRDRRSHVAVPVRVVANDGREWTGQSVDLSVAGIRVRAPGGMKTSDAATLTLTLAEPVYLELPSVSVRVGSEEQAYRFVGLTDRQRSQLASIVTSSPAAAASTAGPSSTSRVAPHLRILHAIAEAASGTLDADGTLTVALEALTHITGHETSSLHLIADDGRTLVLRGERGLSRELRRVNETLVVGEGLVGRVAATGESFNVPDVLEDPDLLPDAREAVREAGVGAFLSVAIRSHGRTFGTLSLGRRSHEMFTAAEVALVEASASQVGLALENARLAFQARQQVEELKRAESQLAESARLSTLGQLSAGLAHDVAQPVMAILAQVELMLRRGDQSHDTRNRLAMVLEEATRASRLLQNLLQIARPQLPERVRCALDRELSFVLALLAPQLRRSGIRVVTEIENPPTIWADAAQMRQVVLNLVQNAAQALASHRGERVLTVRLQSSGDRARLEVLDSGPGIPPEALPRIFDAFFSTKPAGEGTGLGLWVASAIVTAHEGRIWAEHRPEGGAAFIVDLPLGS